jgi:hypothetical protein
VLLLLGPTRSEGCLGQVPVRLVRPFASNAEINAGETGIRRASTTETGWSSPQIAQADWQVLESGNPGFR